MVIFGENKIFYLHLEDVDYYLKPNPSSPVLFLSRIIFKDTRLSHLTTLFRRVDIFCNYFGSIKKFFFQALVRRLPDLI